MENNNGTKIQKYINVKNNNGNHIKKLEKNKD